MPPAVLSSRPRTVALALTCALACKPAAPTGARPDLPLPTDIAALPLFDPAAHGPGRPPPAAPPEPLAVLDIGPQGSVGYVSELHVRFNQPVVSLALPGADPTSYFIIDPPLPGAARWAEPDRLVFRPSEQPRGATRYRVRLAPGTIKTLDDQFLKDPPSWSFETERPQVHDLSLIRGATDVAIDAPVVFYFDQPIAARELAGYLTASARPIGADGPGAPVDLVVRPTTRADLVIVGETWRSERLAQLLTVRPRTRWPSASTIALDVRPGLQGARGPLPLDSAYSHEFSTPQPQTLIKSTCTRKAPCGFDGPVLTFRNPVHEDDLAKISVTPRPARLEVERWGEREVSLTGAFLPHVDYTIRVAPGLRDSFGQTMPAASVRAAFIEQAGLQLSSSTGILPTARPHVGLETHHLRRVRVRVGLFNHQELAAIADTDDLEDRALALVPFPADARSEALIIDPRGPTRWGSQALDLAALTAPLRPAGPLRGAVLVEVTPLELVGDARRHERPPPVRGLFRVTDLMLVAHASRSATVVRALDLSSGTPVAGVELCRLGPAEDDPTCRPLGTTDAAGLLRTDVPFPARLRPPPNFHEQEEDELDTDDDTDEHEQDSEPPAERLRLIARAAGGDHTHLDLGLAPALSRRENPQLRPGERLMLGLVRERGAYRPGERVHLVGWSAIETPHNRHTLATLGRNTPVQLSLRDSHGDLVAQTTGRTTAAGKFSATFDLPDDARLGRYVAAATLVGETATVDLKVEDYRVPEFSVRAAPRRPDILHKEHALTDVRAEYYFGGPVDLIKLHARTDCDPLRYRPPNVDGMWSVGPGGPTPGRTWGARVDVPARPGDPRGQRTLDSVAELHDPRFAHRCSVSVFAEDASAQGVGAETSYLVHPSALYLAVQPPTAATHVGDRAIIKIRGLGRDGDRVAATGVRLDLERHWDVPVYQEQDGRKILTDYAHKHVALPPCTVDLAAAGPDATCTVTADAEGEIRIAAAAAVDGRTARTDAAFHVSKRPDPRPAVALAPPRGLELRPSATTVRPGDRVDVVIRGPWSGARGQLVSARAGVHDVVPFVLDGDQATVSLVADDTWTPSLHLEAHVVTRDARGLLHRHSAAATLSQAPDHRRLHVSVEAPRTAGPRDRLPISVTVRDDQGRPTAGRVALWAVDEAVLALTDERLPDLLPRFVPDRRAEVDDYDDFWQLRVPYVPRTHDPWLVGGGGGAGFGSRSTRVPAVRSAMAEVEGAPSAREKFETTPLFLADAAVDASGRARVVADLPDNLTTFRITAIASAPLAGAPAAPGRFGGAEARTVVSAPLIVRAVAPRGLRPGDTAELAALVENRTGRAGRVAVSADLLAATGPSGPALEFLSKTTDEAALAVGGQARVAFQVRARAPVDARLELRARFAAEGTTAADAVRVELPVAAEATLIDRVAVHGALTSDRAAQIPVQVPRGALAGLGGLELTASASLTANLEDAARALVDYPYGCAEQTASRLVPLLALRELSTPVPDDYLAATLARLARMQTEDGGFAYWPGDPDVHPYASAYATWTLQRAAAAGLPVPRDMLARALRHLEAAVESADLTALASRRADAGVTLALALHALAEAGVSSDAVDAAASALHTHRGRLPLFARATLLLALHRRDPHHPHVRALADELLGNLSEGPSEAHTVERLSHDLDAYFHSDARSDALVLLALLHARPDHPALAKLARGLEDRRRGGAWRNTQENAYAVAALAGWTRLKEPAAPDLQARVWLAGRTALDAPLRGREATAAVHTPMVDLLALTQKTDGLLPVVLQRQGDGPLYYRLGLDWAPGGDDLPARAQGLALTRTLRGETATPRLGDPIAVDLELRADRRTRYVAVDIPVPAGLEPLQQDLGKGQAAASLTGTSGRWFDHQELRRDRVLLFIDDLPPGTHTHTIHLRATSRGSYAFPPARAEAMYIPEIYGRTTATRLTVR